MKWLSQTRTDLQLPRLTVLFNMESTTTKVNGEPSSSPKNFSLYLVFSPWSLTEISKHIETKTEEIPTLMKINFKHNRETIGTLVLLSKESGDKLDGKKTKDFSFYAYKIREAERPKNSFERWGFIVSLPKDLTASFIRERLNELFNIFVKCGLLKPDDFSISVRLQSRSNDNNHTGKCFINFDNLEKRLNDEDENLSSTTNTLMNNIVYIKALLQDSIWDDEYPLDENLNRIRCSWLSLTTNKSKKKKKKFKRKTRHAIKKSSKGTDTDHKFSVPDLSKFPPKPQPLSEIKGQVSKSDSGSTDSISESAASKSGSIVSNRRSLYKRSQGTIMSVKSSGSFTIPLVVGANK